MSELRYSLISVNDVQTNLANYKQHRNGQPRAQKVNIRRDWTQLVLKDTKRLEAYKGQGPPKSRQRGTKCQGQEGEGTSNVFHDKKFEQTIKVQQQRCARSKCSNNRAREHRPPLDANRLTSTSENNTSHQDVEVPTKHRPRPTEIKANRPKGGKTLPQANVGAKRQVDNRNAATTVQDQQ